MKFLSFAVVCVSSTLLLNSFQMHLFFYWKLVLISFVRMLLDRRQLTSSCSACARAEDQTLTTDDTAAWTTAIQQALMPVTPQSSMPVAIGAEAGHRDMAQLKVPQTGRLFFRCF